MLALSNNIYISNSPRKLQNFDTAHVNMASGRLVSRHILDLQAEHSC